MCAVRLFSSMFVLCLCKETCVKCMNSEGKWVLFPARVFLFTPLKAFPLAWSLVHIRTSHPFLLLSWFCVKMSNKWPILPVSGVQSPHSTSDHKVSLGQHRGELHPSCSYKIHPIQYKTSRISSKKATTRAIESRQHSLTPAVVVHLLLWGLLKSLKEWRSIAL